MAAAAEAGFMLLHLRARLKVGALTQNLHRISLLVSRILTGAIMSLVGSTLRRTGKRVVQIETFWFGFAFALGMALVRFLFAA